MEREIDLASIASKGPKADRHVQLVVIGAGEAGVAAAIEAAKAGVDTVLIDENPLDINMMAQNVPLFFGQRMQAAMQNRSAMLDRVVQSNEALAEAFDAGVDVQLGTYVWGAFRNSANVREMEGPLLGLADNETSWLLGFDRLIVAAGARDLGMAYAGWDKAGSTAANGVWSLLTRYRALNTQRMVVLGSGTLALKTALLAAERGIQVAGIVEVLPAVRGDAGLRTRLEQRGVPFFTAHTVREARGRVGEIESVVLVKVGGDLMPVNGSETEIQCDTVCTALGLVPNVELLSLLDCTMAFRADCGGWVPETDEWMRTSIPFVYTAGDCAGVTDEMVLDANVARSQGRLAGIAAAASLGVATAEQALALRRELPPPNGAVHADMSGYWQTWLHSLVNTEGWNVYTCICEEVSRRELVDVQPPRYLNWKSERMAARNLKTLLRDGPLNQDHIKRLTRAGMGWCQGRRCREQIGMLLADEADLPIGELPMATYRAPVRPLPLSVLWPHDEPEEMRENWVSWLGLRTSSGFGARGLRPKPVMTSDEAIEAIAHDEG